MGKTFGDINSRRPEGAEVSCQCRPVPVVTVEWSVTVVTELQLTVADRTT